MKTKEMVGFTQFSTSFTKTGNNLHRQVKTIYKTLAKIHNRIIIQAPSSLRNERAERALRRAKEGTAVALTQSGLAEEWQDCAMECCCYLRNVHDTKACGKTAFEKRFLEKFDVPSFPLRTLFEHVPTTV